MTKKYLRVQKTQITNGGSPVTLKGVNLGGWLMMEGYIMHALNFPVKKFKDEFKRLLGEQTLKEFEQLFYDNFIQEEDIKNISSLGFNCIRVPFHYGLIEESYRKYDLRKVARLDALLDWAEKYDVFIILDLHAAAGCQNHDWHSDSDGKSELWIDKKNQERTIFLWEFLADRYKERSCIAGYDLINESVTDNIKVLNQLYKDIIKAIRKVDRNHILFVEGNKWATQLDVLDVFDDDNHALSIHTYEPLDFTFNFVPHLHYPLSSEKKTCNKDTLRQHLDQYFKISQQRQVPIYVGEFGVNFRNGYFNEHIWLKDNLDLFKEFGFHWTYWTYKAIKNSAFPDGVFSYYDNPSWVNRPGPVMGWDTFKTHWKDKKNEMAQSWRTENFKPNTLILETLKNAVR